jgi:hypothetical protein
VRNLEEARLLAALARCKQLQEVEFYSMDLTDAAVERLATWSALRRLKIQGAKLSHRSVAQFARMKSLEQLEIARCGLNPEEIDQLRKALPKAKVIADGHR